MNLVINTSTKKSLVALAKGKEFISKEIWQSELRHSEELLPRIDGLLRKNNISIDNIFGIIVMVGPGSYTGIRVGVSTSNALGFALEIPVVGINCLELLAHYATSEIVPISTREIKAFNIVSLIKSIYDKYYCAAYKSNQGRLKLIDDYANQNLNEILTVVEEPVCLVGEIESKVEKIIKGKLKSKEVKILPAYCLENRVLEVLAGIGGKRLSKAARDSLCTPLYINEPHITLPKK